MRYAVALLAVVFVAVAAVRGSGPTRPDLRVVNGYADLLGSWKLVAIEMRGKQQAVSNQIRVFDYGRLAVKGPNFSKTIAVTIDSSKRPAWMTFSPNQLGYYDSIYRVQGDTLQICMADANAPRPDHFATDRGGKSSIGIHERHRPEPPRPLSRLVVAEP
jgi:uncharacterized protein (TIGR03067 family)